METLHRTLSDPPSSGSRSFAPTAEDQQFARFIEAADQLGEHLTCIFDVAFVKLVSHAYLGDAKATEILDGSDSVIDNDSSGSITGPKKADGARAPNKSDGAQPPSAIGDLSSVVRLHFAEAMMVMMFNALDDRQQSSVKQGFERLLEKANSAIPGVSPETLQMYRDALRAMYSMLSSNPKPEEMAVALTQDFARRIK